MAPFMALAQLVSLDLFAETRMPCWFAGFDYFDRIVVTIVAPPLLVALVLGAGVARAAWRGHDRVLWKAAPSALFVLDLIYPIVCRTLCQPVQLLICR